MDKLKQRIKEEVESIGYYLYDLVKTTREGETVLSVEIENDSFIDIDDCVKVSEHLSPVLDELDPIQEAYNLEITSAGAERQLKTFEQIVRARGKFVHVETFEQTHEGILEKITETDIIIIDKRKRSSTVLMADINVIRLALDF